MIISPRLTRPIAGAGAVLAAAALVTVAVGTAGPAGAGQTSAGQGSVGASSVGASSASSTHADVPWVAARSTCATPASPGAFRCFAEKLVTVPAHTTCAVPRSAAAIGHGPGGGLSPADLGKFYAYNRDAGTALTVGIVIWGNAPRARADLNHFDAHYGLPTETSASLRIVNGRGSASPLPTNDPDTYGEIALDTQTIRAVCAHCRILLVEAPINGNGNPSSAGLAQAENTAVRLGAKVISNSWGGPERGSSATLQNAFHHPGVAITASTGDNGWNGWDFATYGGGSYADNMPSFPATSPYVVAVGGTTITPHADGTRANEVVWSSDGDASPPSQPANGGATGGGCSLIHAAPGWQINAPNYSRLACHGKRSGTDIAVDGNPRSGLSVYNSDDGGWGLYGGTSLSSPIVAGMYALAGGSGGSAYPAGSLYVNADTLHRSSASFDVVSGGNAYCGRYSTAACADAVRQRTSVLGLGGQNNPNSLYAQSVVDCSFPRTGSTVGVPSARDPKCNASVGFDGPSGLGAPRGLGLFHDTSPGGLIITASTAHAHTPHAFRAKLVPITAAKIAAVSWSWGDGTKHSTGLAPKHTFARAGRYTVSMAARDSLSQRILRKVIVTVR